MGSYREYCEYLFAGGHEAEEMVHLIDVVTTNKTDFFREKAHFDLLQTRRCPSLRAMARTTAKS